MHRTQSHFLMRTERIEIVRYGAENVPADAKHLVAADRKVEAATPDSAPASRSLVRVWDRDDEGRVCVRVCCCHFQILDACHEDLRRWAMQL